MKKYLITLLIFSLLILFGCFTEATAIKDNPDSNWVNKAATVMGNQTACPKNQYWDYRYGTCMCNSDYYMQNGVCISKSLRECIVDRDCRTEYGANYLCVNGNCAE